MAKSRQTSSLGVVGQQRQLSVKERQFIAATRREAAATEKDAPGTIHAVRFSCSAKSIEAEIVFDRDRDRGEQGKRGVAHKAGASGGLPTGARADKPKGSAQSNPPPRRGNPPPRTPRDGTAGGTATSKTSTKPKADLTSELESMQLDDDSRPETDPRLSKPRVKALEKAVKQHITAIVRSKGGDEKTGGALLDQKRTYMVGTHKVTLRLMKGSPAADTPQDEFQTMLEGVLYDGNPDVELDDGLEYYLEPTDDLHADDARGDEPSRTTEAMEGCQPAKAGC